MDAVTLSLFCKPIGKNDTRFSKIRKYSDTIITIDTIDTNLFDRQNQVNLLLLEKKHYVYIKNLFSIMHYSSDSSDSDRS